MPVFEYSAVNREGKVERGLEHGPSLDAVAQALAARGLQVQQLGVASSGLGPQGVEPPAPVEGPRVEQPSVAPQAGWTPPPTEPRNPLVTNVVGPLVGRVPLTRLQFFFRQLATMLHAGINPMQALETLAHQTDSGKLRAILLEAKDHVTAGRPMSACFQRYPEVFTPLMVSMVRTGEEGGSLDQSMSQLADYLQRDIELRNLIRRETIYPKLVIGASIVIILAANAVIASVAPAGSKALDSPLTRPATWFVLGPALIALFLFVRLGLRSGRIKELWDAFVLHIPWVGPMVHGFAMAKFGRAFGALYKNGVPVAHGLKLAADSCGNEAVRARIYPAAQKVQEGAGITETLRGTRAFNPIVLDMTATGETTGNLDLMLTKMSEFYEGEGETKAKQSAVFLGIIAILAVGAYIGFVVIRFWMGYFGSLTQGI